VPAAVVSMSHEQDADKNTLVWITSEHRPWFQERNTIGRSENTTGWPMVLLGIAVPLLLLVRADEVIE
jgi:hypothetical protein